RRKPGTYSRPGTKTSDAAPIHNKPLLSSSRVGIFDLRELAILQLLSVLKMEKNCHLSVLS
ncbi:MAG: hypothetical protein IKL03_08935, partial [Bacteroidaceae bacterium]|nr:hypothetical protein [Bacteroidaceae bacterium]